MVQWRDTQALFGMTLALNLGYYALREFLAPTFAKYQFAVEAAKGECKEMREILARLPERVITPNRVRFVRDRFEILVKAHESNISSLKYPYSDYVVGFEAKIANVALLAAALSLCLLFYGTLHPGHDLSARWVWVLAIICLIPPIYFVFNNLLVLHMMRHTSRYLAKIREQLQILRQEATEELEHANHSATDSNGT